MMVILGPLAGLTTSAVTVTLASLAASLVTVPPSTTSSGVRSMLSPGAPATLSISRTSPTDTFSWRPPARTIAYTGHSLSMVSETAHTLEPSRSSRGFAGHRSVGAPTHDRTGSPVPRPNQPVASPPAVTVRGGPAGATTRPRCRRGRDGGLLTGAAYAVSSSSTCVGGGLRLRVDLRRFRRRRLGRVLGGRLVVAVRLGGRQGIGLLVGLGGLRDVRDVRDVR